MDFLGFTTNPFAGTEVMIIAKGMPMMVVPEE